MHVKSDKNKLVSCARHFIDKTISSMLFLMCACFSPSTNKSWFKRGLRFQNSSAKISGRIDMTFPDERWLSRRGRHFCSPANELASPQPLIGFWVTEERTEERVEDEFMRKWEKGHWSWPDHASFPASSLDLANFNCSVFSGRRSMVVMMEGSLWILT